MTLLSSCPQAGRAGRGGQDQRTTGREDPAGAPPTDTTLAGQGACLQLREPVAPAPRPGVLPLRRHPAPRWPRPLAGTPTPGLLVPSSSSASLKGTSGLPVPHQPPEHCFLRVRPLAGDTCAVSWTRHVSHVVWMKHGSSERLRDSPQAHSQEAGELSGLFCRDLAHPGPGPGPLSDKDLWASHSNTRPVPPPSR